MKFYLHFIGISTFLAFHLSSAFASPEIGNIDVKEFQAFVKRQNDLIEGDTKQCGSASGLYQINHQRNTEQMRFVYLSEEDQISVWNEARSEDVLQILAAQPLPVNKRKQNGLLIQSTDGWFLIEGIDFETLPFPLRGTETDPILIIKQKGYSGTHLKELAKAWSQYRRSGITPQGYRITEIEFRLDMLEGTSESNFSLDYLPEASVLDYLDQIPRTITNFQRFMSPKAVRIPPKMYELMNESEFLEARESRHFSKMMDLIYLKALDVMDGDRFSALFISLLMTDLRSRGPCGAIYGKRGYTISPITIFDGETFSYVNPSRRDAAPHFFAYALMANLVGGRFGGPIISTLGKEQQYRFPQFANLFRRLHMYPNESAEDAGIEFTQGLYTKFTGSTFKRERLRIDIKRDKFYNQLGLDFGNQNLSSVLPSMVLNDRKYFSKKRSLGLGLHNEGPWEAYHLDLSIPRLKSLPIEERTDDLPAWPERYDWAISEEKKVVFNTLHMIEPGVLPDLNDPPALILKGYIYLASLDVESLAQECASRKERLESVEDKFLVSRFFLIDYARKHHEPCTNIPLIKALKKAFNDQLSNEDLRPTDEEMLVFKSHCERDRDDFTRVNACWIHNNEMEQRIIELGARQGKLN